MLIQLKLLYQQQDDGGTHSDDDIFNFSDESSLYSAARREMALRPVSSLGVCTDDDRGVHGMESRRLGCVVKWLQEQRGEKTSHRRPCDDIIVRRRFACAGSTNAAVNDIR